MKIFRISEQIILFVIIIVIILDKIFSAKLIEADIPWYIFAILCGIALFIALPDILEINFFELFKIKRSLGEIKQGISDLKIIVTNNKINNTSAAFSTTHIHHGPSYFQENEKTETNHSDEDSKNKLVIKSPDIKDQTQNYEK